MKAMNTFILGLSLVVSAQVMAATATTAKVAELAVHRLEKLIQLNKLGENYSTDLYAIETKTLTAATANDPQFLTTVSLYPGADGKSNQVLMYSDVSGKVLRFETTEAGASANVPSWPDQGPVTLLENALHHVLDHGDHLAELTPYKNNFRGLTLIQKKDSQNRPVAEVDVLAENQTKKLIILLDMSAKVISAEVEK